MEAKEFLSASVQPVHVGVTYLEDSNKTDQSSALNGTTTKVADLFEISYSGGADGTELTTLTLALRNAFFDTASGGVGVYGSFPFTIVAQNGFDVTSCTVDDGGATLTLKLSGFNAGEKLVFSIDVDEQGNLQPNAVVEGAEIEGAALTASFIASHYKDLTISDMVVHDDYDFTGTGLENLLPNNNYDNAAALAYVPESAETGPVYTAGAYGSAQQTPKPITLSGTVYGDLNANNKQETGDLGINNTLLTLYVLNDNGSYVPTGKTTYTDANGDYQFTNLDPGTYKVVETNRSDYIISVGNTPGTVNSVTRGVSTSVDILSGIALEGGDNSVDNDFADTKPASVSGYVYVDADNDGNKDSGEAGIANVDLNLLDANGKTVATTTTDSSGYYYFGGLTPGATYTVAEAQPAGYYDGKDTVGNATGTANNPGDSISGIVLVSEQAAINYNFGELPPAAISGIVYVERNNNITVDANDTRLSGVTIYLYDASGNYVGQTTTNANGEYSFTDLQPGTYSVVEIQPAGYLEYGSWAGTVNGATVGSVDVENIDKIDKIALSWGNQGINYNFAEVVPATISGYVFQDGPTILVAQGQSVDVTKVRDGRLTSDDTRLAGVTLILCDGSGVPLTDDNGNQITTVTDANGYYAFTGLLAGSYAIREIRPTGYTPGIDTSGSNGGLVVNTYTYSTLDAQTLSTLAVTSTDTVIAKIALKQGDAATLYNFSEVVIQTFPPITPPDPPTPPVLPPPTQLVVGDSSILSSFSGAVFILQSLAETGASGGPTDYTWHLSVIDGGSPRSDASADASVVYTPSEYFDPATWTGDSLDQCEWTLANKDGAAVKNFRFGLHRAVAVAGDWDGSGFTKIGVFLEGLWFFDLDGNGQWDQNDLWAKLGRKNDQPVTGDWDGDDKTDIGIFGPSWTGDSRAIAVEPGLPDAQNMLAGRQKNIPPDAADAAVGYRTMKRGQDSKMRSDVIDHVFQYGTKGDIAVTGDWNGDGINTIGIFRNGAWFLDIDGDGRWSDGDQMFHFGQEGDIPVVGDWTGDGVSKVGLYRHGAFHLDTNNNHQIDAQDKVFELGSPGDKPVVGDWNGEGIDKVGVFHDPGSTTADAAPSMAAP